jgi:phosphatidate cytidylyltransferase
MLKQRIITAAILAAVFFAALFGLSTQWFGLVCLAVLGGAGYEWAKLSGLAGNAAAGYAGLLAASGAGLLFAPGGGVASPGPSPLVTLPCALATAFWIAVAPLWIARGWPTGQRVAMLALGALVLVSMWLALVQLHARSPWLLLATMAIVWFADTGAYFTGRRFGRRKLAPKVSPGKSWEGVYGGLACVGVFALLVVMLAPEMAAHRAAVLAAALALASLSVVGDLFESWLKRNAGVKDSGALLPGHGGLLDRIDALMPVLPAATLLAAAMS